MTIVREHAERRGFKLLFVPPYSPEYNPIELMFGVIKNSFYRQRYLESFGQQVAPVVVQCIKKAATSAAIQGCFRHVSKVIEASSVLYCEDARECS